MHRNVMGIAAAVLLWSGLAQSASICHLVGAWHAADGPVALTFTRDGQYLISEDGTADAGGGPGMESGLYTWNPDTGELIVTVLQQTNGDWGLSHSSPMTISVSGNTLTLLENGGADSFALTRVAGASAIVGSWYVGDTAQPAVVTFHADGSYLIAMGGPADATGQPGMERGTYTWDSGTGAFSSVTLANTSGEWGFSHSSPPFVTVEGNRMTLSDDGTVFTRVAAPLDCARGDSTGDGKADVLWRHTGPSGSGENYLYPMDGTAILPGEGYLRTVADGMWVVVGRGDFDGDGRSDILWRHDVTGENYVYLMSGTAIAGEGYLRTVADQNWRVAGVGDFDGDGKDDILWRNGASGENYVYPMDGLAIKPTEGYLRTVAAFQWQVMAVADFDGDGKDDILWRHLESGENYLYPMDGLAIKPSEGYLRTVADTEWFVAAAGDFDGDGRADIFWRHESTGQSYLYPMNGTTILAGEGYSRTVADPFWRIVQAGDFDGDGKADLLWRNGSTGENYLYPMEGLGIKPAEGYLRTVPDTLWTVMPYSQIGL